MCACRGCCLLFTPDGAGGGRFRAVPDRYLVVPRLHADAAQWDALQIPVSVAFFFLNSTLDQVAAFYPSPAGATESLLPLDAWDEIVAANPELATLRPDVEASWSASDRAATRARPSASWCRSTSATSSSASCAGCGGASTVAASARRARRRSSTASAASRSRRRDGRAR